jgi:hypothetical protein
MKTIESLQRWLRAKGFDAGPIDGIDGPWTFAAWSAPKRLDLPFRVVSQLKSQSRGRARLKRRRTYDFI